MNNKLFECKNVEEVKSYFLENINNKELQALQLINHYAKNLTHTNSKLYEEKENIKETLFEGTEEYDNKPLTDIVYRDPETNSYKDQSDYDMAQSELNTLENELDSIDDDSEDAEEDRASLESDITYYENYMQSAELSKENITELVDSLHERIADIKFELEDNENKKEDIYMYKTAYLLKNFKEFNFLGTHTVGVIKGYLLEKDGYSFHIPANQVPLKFVKGINVIKNLGAIPQIGNKKIRIDKAEKALQFIKKIVGNV